MIRAPDFASDAVFWLDVSHRGRIRATGEDCVRLLHALASMPLEELPAGSGTEAFFLSPQGRIQVVARIYVDQGAVLLETDPERRQALLDYLEHYIIMDDVALEDLSATTAAFAVEGGGSATVLAALGGADLPAEDHACIQAGTRMFFRSSIIGGDGFWLMTALEDRDRIVSALGQAGAVEASPEQFEAARVLNRRPRWGVDYSDKNIPHETQQLHLVSFSKGCYVGQEIVERVRSQGQVQRLLAPIEADLDAAPANLDLLSGDQVAGRLTSPVIDSAGSKLGGFALLRRAYAEPGTQLRIGDGIARVLPWN